MQNIDRKKNINLIMLANYNELTMANSFFKNRMKDNIAYLYVIQSFLEGSKENIADFIALSDEIINNSKPYEICIKFDTCALLRLCSLQ